MEPMKGKWASSRVDVGYTELFCIPEVTAVFLSSCDCVLWGLSGVPSSTLRPFTCLIGNMELLCTQCRGLVPLLPPREMFNGISLELRQEPGVYSRVTAGMAIRNSTLFSEVRTPVKLGRTPQESKVGLAG